MSEQQVVVRFYTQARKIPFLLGKVGDWKIWGGPYTLTQAVVFIGVAYAGKLTMPFWATGWIPILAWIPILIVAAAAAIGAGRVPLKGRNPLLILLGVIGYFDAPSWGTQGGNDVALKKTRRIRLRSSTPTRTPWESAVPAEETEIELTPDGEGSPELGDEVFEVDPLMVEVASSRAPAPPQTRPMPHQLSEVQQILATSAQRR